MSWICEKEEWLLDWENARLQREVVSGATTSAGELQRRHEVTFSEIAEVEERCFLVRACGNEVDFLDLSPASPGLFAWRISLPSVVLPRASIALVTEGANLIAFILTVDGSVHKVVAALGQSGILEVSLLSSTTCGSLPVGTSVAFCAVSSLAVALAAAGAPLRVIRTCTAGSGPVLDAFELWDASNLKRILHAVHISNAKTPPAIAAVSVDALSKSKPAGVSRLLVLHQDAHLRLWAVGDSRGHVVCAAVVAAMEVDRHNYDVELRVSPCQNWACLAIQGKGVFVVSLQAGLPGSQLSLRDVALPFPGAVASKVYALSKHSLWGYWSAPNREPELFRVNLVDPTTSGSTAGCQAAAICAGGTSDRKVQALMVDGSTRGSAASAQPVFTAERQHEVWSAEENSWDLHQLADVADTSRSLEERLLKWWMGRIFMCGRFSATVIQDALQANGENPRDMGLTSLQQNVRDFLQARAAPPGSTLTNSKGEHSAAVALQAAYALNAAAADFTRACEGAWQSRRKVFMLGVSHAWARHSWQPAGANAAGDAPDVCPILLCAGGLAAIRPVHHWAERWWATLHFTRHLSSYERLEVENILQLSQLDEWRLCATAWFLSQCINGAGLGIVLGIMPNQLLPSETAKRFAPGVPDSLKAHLEKCTQSVRDAQSSLETLQKAIMILSGSDSPVDPRTVNAWDIHEEVCLSDILRGGIFASECNYASTVVRDLVLVCARIFQSPVVQEFDTVLTLLAASVSSLRPVPRALASRIRTHTGTTSTGLKRRLGLALPDLPLVTRTCDIWAAEYRNSHGALRPPLASVNSLAYALKLLEHECWDSVQAWSENARAGPLAAYLAGRELLVKGEVTSAKDALCATGSVAPLLGSLLQGPLNLDGTEDPDLAYLVHLAGLFGSHGAHAAEREFYEKAAEACNQRRPGNLSHCQALWSTAFEKAICVCDWDAALRAILKLPEIENQRSHLRLLSQHLRSGGCGEVLLTWKLPEELKSFLFEDLRQHAQLGAPTSGSGALDCYRILYALHIADKEYLKAATTAYLLHVSLAAHLEECLGGSGSQSHSSATPVHDGVVTLSQVATRRTPGGDTISDPGAVPISKCAPPEHALGPMVCEEPTKLWPLFDQQRRALLMAISALSLTEEGAFLAPATPGATPVVADVALSNFGGEILSAADLALVSAWMQGSAQKASQALVALEDLQKLLTVVECRLALAARGGAFLAAPPDLAKGLAELGLLALALRLVKSHGLDPWPNALQPFTQLCVHGEDDGTVVALASAARGLLHAHMFVCTDSYEPLGCDGSVLTGCWQTLEAAIKSLSGDIPAGKPASAAALRLRSLVAAEVLSSSPTAKLPDFLEKPFVEGNAPAWTCLLRLYMKYDRIEEALALLENQLTRAEPMVGQRPAKLAYMVDFPAALVVQLRRAVEARAQADPRGKALEHLKILDKTLEGIRGVLKDIGNSP